MSSEPGPSPDADELGSAETVHPGTEDTALGSTDTVPATDDTVGSADHLGKRPDSDRLVRAVARAKIAGQLFQKKEQVKLGRYHLLEMIGAGGMGVVWGAWDPELDRLVAIKLVKAEMQGVRDRILIEGQALAKVSHPNIVPVFDVGVVDEQVYLVMEWVRGKNLRAYCKTPRTVREILAIYRSAADGLVAAHAAGIIHRDFKPDNAILGDDGRVRILDFGLARGEVRADRTDPRTPSAPGEKSFSTPSSDLTRGAGTPRYMPPEQAEGRELTPAVDQYAFCVSLREALVERTGDDKKADVPKWIDEILTKGTAREATNRHPSMAELLHALSNDPATVRRRRLLIAGGVAVAATTFAVGMFAGGSDGAVERCGGGKAEIAHSWNAAVQQRLRSHLHTLGPYATGEAPRIERALEDYTQQWAVAHREGCLGKESGVLTSAVYERNLGCLGRSRVALDTMVEVLSKASDKSLSDAIAAVGVLPDASRCLLETQTSTIEPPGAAIADAATALGNEIERVRVLAHAQMPDAIAAAAEAVKRAKALGYLPLVARAHYTHGLGSMLQAKQDTAMTSLDIATTTALETGDDGTAVESFARLIYSVSSSEPKDVPAGMLDRIGAIAVVEAIARRESTVPPFQRYLFFNNVGLVKLARGEVDAARTWLERARRERDRVTTKEPELAIVWTNLAMVTPDPAARSQLMGREVQELESTLGLGPDHPHVLDAKMRTAVLIEPPRAAFVALTEPCRRLQRLHPHLLEKILHCTIDAGWLAEELDDRQATKELMTVVAKLEFPPDVTVIDQQLAPSYLELVDGRYRDAMASGKRVAEALGKTEHHYSQVRALDAWIVVARAAIAAGEQREARAALERGQAVLGKLTFLETMTLIRRRKHRVSAMLAGLLQRDDPATAKRLATEALAWYRNIAGYEVRVRELEAIVRADSR